MLPPVAVRESDREAFAPKHFPKADRAASTPEHPPVVNKVTDREAFMPELPPKADWAACTPVLALPSGFKDDIISLLPDCEDGIFAPFPDFGNDAIILPARFCKSGIPIPKSCGPSPGRATCTADLPQGAATCAHDPPPPVSQNLISFEHTFPLLAQILHFEQVCIPAVLIDS